MPTSNSITLASQSPGRLELLRSIGIEPNNIHPANIDETPHKNEIPKDYVLRLAIEKAVHVAPHKPNDYIIAADTIASCGRRIIGKPKNIDDARNIIKLLSGRRHRLYSAVCVIAPGGELKQKTVMTTVKFKHLHNDEIEQYLQTNQWQGKAGGYALQGYAGAFIESINGSYSNVIGLPLVTVKNMLSSLKF